MRVKISSEEELVQMTQELLHIIVNMRYWQKEWHEHYGGMLLDQKRKWEKRADDLINKYKMQKTSNSADIEIDVPCVEPEKESRPNRWVEKSSTLQELVAGKYCLQVIKMDDVNYYWDVSYNGKMIAMCARDKTSTTLKQAKEAGRWRMEKHKASINQENS